MESYQSKFLPMHLLWRVGAPALFFSTSYLHKLEEAWLPYPASLELYFRTPDAEVDISTLGN